MSRTHTPLLLHICCAPDEAWAIKSLDQTFDLHCYFCNPNIHPSAEYALRLSEAKRAAAMFGVPFDADEYQPDLWKTAIKGLEDSAEGGPRCEACFLLRLRRTAAFCVRHGFLSFATVMSVSPHKQIGMLNRTGQKAAQEYNLAFVEFNFKKNNGFLQSVALSHELGLYRQDYCGCHLSLAQRDQRIAARSIAGNSIGKNILE